MLQSSFSVGGGSLNTAPVTPSGWNNTYSYSLDDFKSDVVDTIKKSSITLKDGEYTFSIGNLTYIHQKDERTGEYTDRIIGTKNDVIPNLNLGSATVANPLSDDPPKTLNTSKLLIFAGMIGAIVYLLR